MIFSDVTICNMALDMLDEAPIASLDDNTRAGRLCKRNYALVRDEVTIAHPWGCAVARTALPAMSDAPAFGWAFQYQLPKDCLRIQPLTVDGAETSKPVPYIIEGRRILTNQGAPLSLRYIKRLENAAEIDPLLARVIACKLGFYVGRLISGKQSFIQQIGKFYSMALKEAKAINARNGTGIDPLNDAWIDAR